MCFAEHKTEKIKRKFYQLRIMDFLARQISLEYEIILKNAQYIEVQPQPTGVIPLRCTIDKLTPHNRTCTAHV